MSDWTQEAQDRAEELMARGANSFPPHVVEHVAKRLAEVQSASVGPHFDRAHLVLGALGEALGRTAQEIEEAKAS